MIWTRELTDAVTAIANDIPNSTPDVRSRAAEYVRHARPGQKLEPFQVEYTHCLLQRLDDRNPLHLAFKEAWKCATSA